MIKKLLLILLSALLMVSCATSNYVNSNPIVTSTTLSVEEKMDALGFDKVKIGNIESFFDGAEWANKALDMVRGAKNYIFVTSFLISECDENQIFFDELINKAKQGVKIYLVQDGMTYLDYTETKKHYRQIAYLADYGIHIHQFNPLSLPRLMNPVGLLLRDHRKLIVVDGRCVALGGRNFSYVSMQPFEDHGQRDSMYYFDSPQMAKVFKRDFIEYWNEISYDTIEEKAIIDVNTEEIEEGVSGWVCNQQLSKINMPEVFGSLFYSAKEEILYIPLYPLFDDGMNKWVQDAVERGVHIEQIVANTSDIPEYKAALYAEKELIDMGVTTYNEYINDWTWHLLHEKLFVIDSRYVVIGSVNFNHRSMMLSEEAAVVIDDVEFAAFMKNHFMQFKDNAYEVTSEEAAGYKNFLNMLLFYVMYIGG